jgi:hypothetical protein
VSSGGESHTRDAQRLHAVDQLASIFPSLDSSEGVRLSEKKNPQQGEFGD